MEKTKIENGAGKKDKADVNHGGFNQHVCSLINKNVP